MALTQVNEPWSSNLGVGSNLGDVDYGAGSMISPATIQGTRQALGNAADWLGGKLGIPETGISEKIAGGPTTNTGAVYAAETGQDLVSALISKGGYNYQDAVNAANGPNADNLRREFLGGGGATGSWEAPAPPTPKTYNIRGTNVTAMTPEQAVSSVAPESDFGQFSSQFNNDPTAFFNQIDQDASNQMAFLDKSQSALDEAFQKFGQLIESDYQRNLSRGQSEKESATGTLSQNQVKAEQRRQDALSAAKQLYDQLNTGYQQKFGGRSTAAQAAAALLGQEQQRQLGQISRDYMNTVSQIEGQKAGVEKQYALLVQDLDYQKQKSQYDALTNYLANLRSIDADRTATEQAKSQAKLQILMNLRDQQNQIAMNDRQYRQELDAMKQQTQMQLDASLKQMQQQAALNTSTGSSLLNDYIQGTQNISSNLGQGNSTRSVSTLSTPVSALESAQGLVSKAPTTVDEFWRQYG